MFCILSYIDKHIYVIINMPVSQKCYLECPRQEEVKKLEVKDDLVGVMYGGTATVASKTHKGP